MASAASDSPLPGLDHQRCYEALLSRDPRFDGRFYVGVSTTGIYCRPICRVRAPRASSCSFYSTAAAAEAQGYRPCLRCRPELAPGLSWVDSPDALARAAAKLLDRGEVQHLPELAQRVGVSERHLRRVFHAHFGVTPIAYAQTQRLLLAKRLLTDTRLPIAEVAWMSGFASLRRFNALFRERYRLAPGDLRKGEAGSLHIDLSLDYRPPYDWDSILAFFRARAVPGVEAVDADSYRRCLRLGEVAGWVSVRHAPEQSRLWLRLAPELRGQVAATLAAVRRQFDVDTDPAVVAATLGALAVPYPGLRLPGAVDGFEQAVRAVLGQQVSVAAATTLAGRLAQRYGEALTTPYADLTQVFPRPQTLVAASVEDLVSLGILRARAATIRAIADAMLAGRLRLDADAPIETALAALRALPGVGEWTAQYIAMRCLSWPDAFPHTDLIVRRALGDRTPSAILAEAERWRPWRAYATLQLWRQS